MLLWFYLIKMEAYSQDLRDRVINLYFEQSYSRKEIATILFISYATVCGWIRRFKAIGNCQSRQHLNPGRPCRYTDRKAILRYLESHPDAGAIEIRDVLCPELPMSTFYDTLHRLKITYKKRAKILAKI